jgi:hypothetical protein
MPYLLLDPTDDYAAHMKRFLDRRGIACVVLFSTPGHRFLWEKRWKAEIGAHVVGEHVVQRESLAETVGALRREHPDGFFGLLVWDERHVLLAAEIAAALGLDWNAPEVIERFRDKSMLKRWLRERSTLRLNLARTVTNAAEATAFQREVGAWPVVVKPTGGAGSMAVHFAESDADLLRACQAVLERGLGEVLLEEYVGGTEYAVNGITDHAGDVLVTEVWRYDRRDSHGERNVYFETIKVSTTEDPFAAVAVYASEAIGALGLRRSPFHMEVKVDDRGPCLIEVGSRFAGGCQPVLGSLLHRHSLFELAACDFLDEIAASADDVDFAHYDRHAARIVSGVQEVEIPCVREVLGLDEVRALPSFRGTGMVRKPGSRVPVSRDVTTKAWEVYLLHPDAEQVARDAAAARALLRYV